MNNKALLRKIIFGVVIVLILFFWTTIYPRLTKSDIKLSTGKVTIDVDYNTTNSEDSKISIAERIQINETNQSQQSLNNSVYLEE